MKIVFIISSLAHVHGVERTFVDKANYLAEHGHNVTMVTYEQGPHEYAYPISSSVRSVDLDCRYFTIFKYSLPKRLLEARKIKKKFSERIRILINDIEPDVVVTSTYEGDFMKEIVALKNKTRIILESHAAFVAHLKGDNLIAKVRKRLVLNEIKKCDLLIALTCQDASYWQRYVKNVKVVANPITCYQEELCQEEKVEGRIIAVGSLQKIKRFDRLIESFSLIADRFKTWYIDIYGEGPDKIELQKIIERCGLVGRVNLKGLSHDIYAEYRRSQFFVLSSDSEGFGLVLVEAMSSGIPVISTDCPFGPSEIVENNVTGLLSKLEVKDLSEKMEWMITHEAERRKMGCQAHKTAARYQQDVVMKKWEAVYRSVQREGFSNSNAIS